MDIETPILRAAFLLALAGCTQAVSPPPDDLTVPSDSELRLEGSVTATFAAAPARSCEPLEFPLTMFATNALGPRDVVGETAELDDAARCVHRQEVAAPVESWATLAYQVVCVGGDDPRLCGATATRRCSAELLMRWAEERSRSVIAESPVFGFQLELPPQDRDARLALHRRAATEVATLLEESRFALDAFAAGTRDCPEEDPDDVAAAYLAGSDMERELGEILDR